MKAEIKDRWIEKLESGEFPQVKGELRGVDVDGEVIGYCCLGVLCEIAVEDGIIERDPEFGGYLAPDEDGDEYRENSLLPKAVADWAGLDSVSPAVPADCIDDPETTVELSELNDAYNQNFKSIAKLIKEHL